MPWLRLSSAWSGFSATKSTPSSPSASASLARSVQSPKPALLRLRTVYKFVQTPSARRAPSASSAPYAVAGAAPPRLRLARAREAHRRAERLASRVRGRAMRALDVVVAAEHAEPLGERREGRARGVAHGCGPGAAPSQRHACGATRTRGPR